MIHHLRHHEIDMERWDVSISQSINGNICAFSWYLDLVAGTWDALVDDDYRSVMPLPWRKKFGVKYIFQPAFIQQLGLFSSDLINPGRVRSFVDAIPPEFGLADINLNKLAPLEGMNVVIRENSNFELELIAPYDILRKGYSENLKRNLIKANGNDLTVVHSVGPESIVELFRKNRGLEIKTMSDHEYRLLVYLVYLLMHKNLVSVMGVFDHRNELCAGAVFTESSDRSVFLFSGLSEQGRKLNAMPFLIDEYIRMNAATKRILDFEGSNDAGLARFYSSFGSQKHHYQSIRLNRLPLIFSPLFWAYKHWKA